MDATLAVETQVALLSRLFEGLENKETEDEEMYAMLILTVWLCACGKYIFFD